MTTQDDERFMKLAIYLAKKCQPKSDKVPYVGAVITTNDGELLSTGYRGEKDHAEYTALEDCVARGNVVVGATVYTTLEPCTIRNPGKVACAVRLKNARVSRVVIGMLDPNQNICGRGVRLLRDARIATELFPSNLMAEVEALNQRFTDYQVSKEARLIPCGIGQRGTEYDFNYFADGKPEELFMVAQNLRSRLDDPAFVLRLEELLAGPTKVTLVLTTWEAIQAIQVEKGIADFKRSVTDLKNLWFRLNDEQRKRLTVRFHKAAASLSVQVRDPREDSDKALLVFTPKWATDTDPEKRPYFALDKLRHTELFNKLYDAFPSMTGEDSTTLEQMCRQLEIPWRENGGKLVSAHV